MHLGQGDNDAEWPTHIGRSTPKSDTFAESPLMRHYNQSPITTPVRTKKAYVPNNRPFHNSVPIKVAVLGG